MTYPPPDPGSPGPAGSWPTGDPHEQPTQHAYPQGAQPEQPGGYPGQAGQPPGYPQPGQQQPGQQPGYQAPGQQPGYQAPGQPPGYPPPGYPQGQQAPGYPPPGDASGYPPGPPGYGPPPGYPPGGMPGQQPPSGGNKTGLLIAGIAGAAVLLLLLVGVGGALVYRSLESDDGDGSPSAGEQPEIEIPEEPTGEAPPAEEPPAEEPPAGNPSGGDYGYLEGLCDEVDISSAQAILPDEHSDRFILEDELNFGSSTSCTYYLTDDRSFGTLGIDLRTYNDVEQAQGSHDTSVEFRTEEADDVTDASGPWEDGVMFYGAPIADAAAEVCVLDGNLATCVRFSLAGEAANDDEMADAVLPIAEDILRLSAV